MKALILTLMVLVSSEGVMAHTSLASRAVKSAKALAFSAALLVIPVAGLTAADSSLEIERIEQQAPSFTSKTDTTKVEAMFLAESDFDGRFYRFGMTGVQNGGGLAFDGGVRENSYNAGSTGLDGDVKYLIQRDGSTNLIVNGEVIDGFGANNTHVGPLWFIDTHVGFNQEYLLAGVGVGVGVELLNDFLGEGHYTSVRLQAGLGGKSLTNYQSHAVDPELYGMLKFVVKTDGLTFGDVLKKPDGTLLHWIPLVPKSKLSAILPVYEFSQQQHSDGDLPYSLQAQIGLTRHVYLVFERYDSYGLDEPSQRATLFLNLIGTP